MTEIWKDIKGFEGLYLISNLGKVRSVKKAILLKTFQSKNGYLFVFLYKDRKCKNFYIHRLVASAFIPNTDNKREVNHKDGNKQNNSADNLEWATRSENLLHAYRTLGRKVIIPDWKDKFGKEHPMSKTILQMDDNGNIIAEYGSISEAFRQTGIGIACISRCCLGYHKAPHAGGYVWKYK